MTVLVSIDDTDNLESRGTGRLARAIADTLARDYPVYGVTRHQLFVHPDIPYTSHNSCAVIHLQTNGHADIDTIFATAETVMRADFVAGSDPGLAVARASEITAPLIAFGKDAKCSIQTQAKARTLAKNLNIRLRGLGGTEDGVIGAMAGLGLAVGLNDGRFLQRGKIREVVGSTTVQALMAAGVDEVCTLDGRTIADGAVLIHNEKDKSPKACPVNGKTVLFVEEKDGVLSAVKRD
jgi:tRNA(Ile2) C34 agmatinyltransferase TiaS